MNEYYKKTQERLKKEREENNKDVIRANRLKVSPNVFKLEIKPTKLEGKVLEGKFGDEFKPLEVNETYARNLTLKERIERIKSSIARLDELTQEYKDLTKKS